MSDTSDPSTSSDQPSEHLDVEAEEQRLDDLGHRIEDTRHQAEEDLEPGHAGRMFADSGLERSLRAEGDEEQPPGDGPDESDTTKDA